MNVDQTYTKHKCPHCKEGNMVVIPADEPWNPEYLQCNKCDSTYGMFSEFTTESEL